MKRLIVQARIWISMGGARRSASLRVASLVAVITITACQRPTDPTKPAAFQSASCPVPPNVALQTKATDWPCPSASVIQEIDSQVTLQFQEDSTAPTLVCHASNGSVDLTSSQEHAYQTLYLIKRLQFDAPLPWTSLSLWDWFTSHVHVIQYKGSEALCCLHDVPGGAPIGFIVPAGPTGPNGLIAGATFPAGLPTDVFGYVHEARHADGYGHDCDGIRDRNISDLGAWGVQYYLGLWIANHLIAPTLTTAERGYAQQASELLRTGGGAFCTACGGL